MTNNNLYIALFLFTIDSKCVMFGTFILRKSGHKNNQL